MAQAFHALQVFLYCLSRFTVVILWIELTKTNNMIKLPARLAMEAHKRLLDRQIKHVSEMRGDLLVVLSEEWPRQEDMLARQLKISETVDELLRVIVGGDYEPEL